MTIQLTSSIAIAGAHQAIGTQLTLGVAMEADLVNRRVASYVGSNPSITPSGAVPGVDLGVLNAISASFVSLGTQTNSFGTPSGVLVDEQGNALPSLAATVAPRTGTLASLLTLAGEVGEIASATDVNALVKFTGVVGGARVFVLSRHKGQALWDAISTAIASATLTALPMGGVLTNPSGLASSLISVTSAQLTVTDVGQTDGFSAGNAAVEVWGYINFAASATPGTYVQVDFQLDFGGTFVTLYSFVYPVIANVITTAVIPLINQTFGSPMKIRLAVKHDATGSRAASGGLNVAIPGGF